MTASFRPVAPNSCLRGFLPSLPNLPNLPNDSPSPLGPSKRGLLSPRGIRCPGHLMLGSPGGRPTNLVLPLRYARHSRVALVPIAKFSSFSEGTSQTYFCCIIFILWAECLFFHTWKCRHNNFFTFLWVG